MKEKHLVKFSTVGALNTVVDLIVFTAVLNLNSVPAYIAQGAGYGAGMLNSFIMNKLWTFKKFDTGSGLAGEVLRFFTVNALSLIISIIMMWLLADIIGVSSFVSKAVILVLTQFINYIGYSYWVFNN